MLFSTLSTAFVALSAFTSFVNAWPKQPRATGLQNLARNMPANTLPPPTGLELKYVLLGLGTQNYTCTSGNATAAPGTTGALAKLYDIGTKLNTDPWAPWKIASISGLALSLSTFGTQQLDMYLNSQGYNEWLGNHFFTETTPTFSLYRVKANPFPLAYVTKTADMDAPKYSCPGISGEGAVKWLQLVDSKGLSQGGINTVYRLETAGGLQPALCTGMKPFFEVPYAAQYWIYGPKA